MKNEQFEEVILSSRKKKIFDILGFFFFPPFYEEFYEREELIARVNLRRILKGKNFRYFEFVPTGYDDIYRININSRYNIMVWEDGHYSVRVSEPDGRCIICRSIGGPYAKRIDKECTTMINDMINERKSFISEEKAVC